MISVNGLRKKFGAVQAVDDISFEIAKGEVVGLLGPNGAGKSTTMRLITGFLKPDSGSVKVDGISVDVDPLEARRCIGYLPENAPLYHDMEVTAFLTYIGRLRKIERTRIWASVGEMVGTCGLEGVVGRPIGELSKGYRQRVGLAAAMIHRPAILILDEPTSGLDPNQIGEIRLLIREIGRERTVVLSTHIMQEVEATCGRAIIMSSGKLVGEGSIGDLVNRSRRDSSYTVGVRASRARIESELSKLSALSFGEWLSEPGQDRQRFTLKGNGKELSEDIFSWAVEKGLVLSELKREEASLEEVFRDLTQNK